jgi:hypothetical protein
LFTVYYLFAVIPLVAFAFVTIFYGLDIMYQDRAKAAVNRAAKAAVHQYDERVYAIEAKIVIDETEARAKFEEVLEKNLKGNVTWEIKEFHVVDESTATFPASVENDEYRFSHEFANPGVWTVVELNTGRKTIMVPAAVEVRVDGS